MSLVAYGSSDESDSEDIVQEDGSTAGTIKSDMFSRLPAPRSSIHEDTYTGALKQTGFNFPIPRDATERPQGHQPPSRLGLPPPRNESSWSDQELDKHPFSLGLPPPRNPAGIGFSLPPFIPGGEFDLPKPKKRSEPVKITIPEIEKGDSDEDEPVKKKVTGQDASLSSGLSSLLPQPRNMTVKETQRPLVPHSLTKQKPEARVVGRPHTVSSTSVNASPSAIKAAAKSATLQLARQIAQEETEEGSDEDLEPENYFSLPTEKSKPPIELDMMVPPGTEPPNAFHSNNPLEFSSSASSYTEADTTWGDQSGEQFYPQYLQPAEQNSGNMGYYQDFYSNEYYQESDSSSGQPEEPSQASFLDDEAFRRLQGKRNRGKEEIKFLEIKGDDQLIGNQQWLTKGLTEEKEQRKSFSKKKGDQPTGQQRRKHQITYLIHQAKERELELKNSWAENKLTRRQTQAKYGF
ncbi:proline-rich protein PRCC [Polypterus senegalus]